MGKEFIHLKTPHTQGRMTEVTLDDDSGLCLSIIFTLANGEQRCQFYHLNSVEARELGQALLVASGQFEGICSQKNLHRYNAVAGLHALSIATGSVF